MKFKQLVIGSVVFGLSAGISNAQVCLLPNFSQLPVNTKYAMGPLMFQATNNVPGLLSAMESARLAWGKWAWSPAHPNGRLGSPSGQVTPSDCPTPSMYQVGLYHFALAAGCPAAAAYQANIFPNYFALAFVYYNTQPDCGLSCVAASRSISINYGLSWSLDPEGDTSQTGQYDVQSVFAHEFGHVLGLGHLDQVGISCISNWATPSCASSNNSTITMGNFIQPEETCQRSLEQTDKNAAQVVYP